MSSKNKLGKFAENETFTCLLQPSVAELLGGDHPLKGHWSERMFHNSNPIVLELGCGKGEYTISLAERFPDRNFIGIDIKGARLWRGARTATDNGIRNAAFIRTRIEMITSLFAPGEISEIWITFADPQEKKPRKRLTHPMFLSRYASILAPGGRIHLKTDSRLLHYYTLAVAVENNLPVYMHDDDIYAHGTADGVLSVKTFYEKSFLASGIAITYMCFSLSSLKEFAQPDWDQTPYEQQYRTDVRSSYRGE